MLQTPTPRCASATFRLLLPLLAAGALGACSSGSGPAT
jgi:hypothetical protein